MDLSQMKNDTSDQINRRAAAEKMIHEHDPDRLQVIESARQLAHAGIFVAETEAEISAAYSRFIETGTTKRTRAPYERRVKRDR